MHYFALPDSFLGILNFTAHTAKKKVATTQKTFEQKTAFSVLITELFGQENKTSNIHNFFLKVQDNPLIRKDFYNLNIKHELTSPNTEHIHMSFFCWIKQIVNIVISDSFCKWQEYYHEGCSCQIGQLLLS